VSAARPLSMRHANALSGLFLLGSAVLILRPLAAFWSRNDAYFFGWGVPFLALYLLYERWGQRPEPEAGNRPTGWRLGFILFAWGFFLLAARLITETEPDSRPLMWVNVSLLVGALLAWFGLLGGRPWVRHFAFPIAFLFLGVPWIFRFEFLVVQGLMRLNAAWVADSLALLDVPARAAGNTIILADGQLGVSEACSGIRSLQATLMMSFFLGEFYRFSLRRRLLLPLLGMVLALAGNYARMLFLAWRGAHDGMASVETVHDSAGFVILAFTVCSLWLICLALRHARIDPAGQPKMGETFFRSPFALRWAAGIFLAAFTAEAATQSWYGWREISAVHFPEWTVAWPANAPQFHSLEIPAAAHEQLHDDAASAASWRDEAGWSWTGTWLHYRAQAQDKAVFAAHNPELCLPAAGWQETADNGSFPAQAGKIHLLVHGYRFESGTENYYVFWVPYLDRGAAPYDEETRGLYGHSLTAIAQLKFPFLADVWNGCRGAVAETLEVAVAGPVSFAEARSAFRQVIARLVLPDTQRDVAKGS
jgi:exosortase